jgi:hypothetical protein
MAQVIELKDETYFSNFPRNFEMVVVWLSSCEECVAICKMDIISRSLHLELLRRKVSIKHEPTRILPPSTGQPQFKQHRPYNLHHWVFTPSCGQVYTRLGAGRTEQGQASRTGFSGFSVAKTVPLAIFDVPPQTRSSHKLPVSVLWILVSIVRV